MFGQKYILIVDEDIDIHDPVTLNWALSSRANPARDMRILPDLPTYLLDPSVFEKDARPTQEKPAPPYPSSMCIIDATLKVTRQKSPSQDS